MREIIGATVMALMIITVVWSLNLAFFHLAPASISIIAVVLGIAGATAFLESNDARKQ